MAFDWKQKLEDAKKLAASSKKIATEGFNAAVEKGAVLSEQLGQKVDELDQKYGPAIEAGAQKLEDKTKEMAVKVGKKVNELTTPKNP